jgi:hypothetical protein
MGLEAGLSEDTLLTIVEQVEGGVDDISDRGKIEITDSTPESFKVAALEQREHERNVLTAQILEKVTSRAYELSKYAKGLITYDTTLGILDAVIEDGLRDISYDGTGELQRPLITTQTWTKFLSRLVEALGPRDVNKALKELNKVINETREKNGLAAVNRTGWTGEKFSSQDPKKQVAATIEKLDGVPTNLDETYKRIAAVVDWYAIVLTDKLWTPNNAPAIIDRRSDLFGQIETLLIQVQDHPLMNGTVNPELDKDAATTPAPQDLLALTAQLEAAMNEAWVKALEMGENYDKTQNPELDQHTLNAIQDLIVKEKKLDYEAAEAYRKARLMLADEEQTPKGESSRLKGNELLREQGTLLAEMNEVKAQRERLEMGTETITNRIRILANSPRLSGRTPQKGLTQGD